MIKISEYVSPGHPDKLADFISSYILDRYIEIDPQTRYAVEVQIKDSFVTLGGEVTSKARFTKRQISDFVRQAISEIGYTKEYQKRWGKNNSICGDNIEVACHLGCQSHEIAIGLSGWGDQGIFFGMYNRSNKFGMPEDHYLAKRLCKALFESSIGGLDIKTQILLKDGTISKVIVAIPLIETTERIEQFVREVVPGDYELIINGTGLYTVHGPIADCGTTGRKLAVDFYGGNCLIGGGSPWTKDGTKADLSLNLYARYLAKLYSDKFTIDTFVKIACCIGRKELVIQVTDCANRILFESILEVGPEEIITKFKLDTPIFSSMCKWGLFGEGQTDKEWEK